MKCQAASEPNQQSAASPQAGAFVVGFVEFCSMHDYEKAHATTAVISTGKTAASVTRRDLPR
jgi:hypothetical protein